MDVSNLLSYQAQDNDSNIRTTVLQQDQSRYHPYQTRRSMTGQNHIESGLATSPTRQLYNSDGMRILGPSHGSPTSPTPKNVAFELHPEGTSSCRARLPMRVQIFPHDTTDSIVTTVKNFYGLYEGTANGVSFEDEQRNTLIARYENFRNNMVVYVRVITDYGHQQPFQTRSAQSSHSPQRLPQLDDIPQMLPPQPAQILHYGQPPSRPGSRISRKQSASPRLGRGQQSRSNQNTRSRSGVKSNGSSFQANLDELNSDAINGYSSSDGGAGSVTSSRKARSEQLASAEISVDNIVEGGRRKRAKFESSELPLFVPPQVPAPNSISSISPQRRSNGLENASPFTRPTQRNFSYNLPVQSPQSYAFGDQAQLNTPQNGTPFAIPAPSNQGRRLRDRVGGSLSTTRPAFGGVPRLHGNGILPTPDPTIASCISDEDVALQLMRLGDASNISHGRTSASTLDDAFSGRADAASSMTSESESESETIEQPSLPLDSGLLKLEPGLPQHNTTLKKQVKHHDGVLPTSESTEYSGDEIDADYEDGAFKSDRDDQVDHPIPVVKSRQSKAATVVKKAHKTRGGSAPTKVLKISKTSGVTKKPRPASLSISIQHPISPASLPTQSRKTSSASTLNFQNQLGADEDDLSSKPRCQRCRKSKKGCDRQRPCQRCKDAGISIEGCVSEDEGNGRKGRYGRHMGVPVKKGEAGYVPDNESQTAGAILAEMAGGQEVVEKSKKRKR